MSLPPLPKDGAGEPDPLIGRAIADKFVIESLLGAGAMGAVYRAHQVALDRPVAIKVMHPQLASDGTYAARFQREAKSASRIDHPNLIRVIDYGQEPDGLLYLVMEFLDGQDLFHVISSDWPLSTSRTIDILSQTLGGLAAAHDAGILHRDLKPENIMLLKRKADDGTTVDLVKVCDFGIAKLMEAPNTLRPPALAAPLAAPTPKLSSAGLVVGTPEFMSPEQARGDTIDARSDLFSIGVILYQILTGRLPFEAETAMSVVLKVLHAEPPPPSTVARVDPALEAICAKAMHKAPDERYRDAREMRSALQRVALASLRVGAAPSPSWDLANARTVSLPIDSPAAHQSSRTTTHTTTGATTGGVRVSRSVRWKRVAGAAGTLLTLLMVMGIGLRRSFKPAVPTDRDLVSRTSMTPTAGPSTASKGDDPVAVSVPAPPETPPVVRGSAVPAGPSAEVAVTTTHVALPGRPRSSTPAHVTLESAADSASAPLPPASAAPQAEVSVVEPPPPPPVALPPVPAALPPSPPFDPAHARVVLDIGRASGFSTASLSRALNAGVEGRINRCYLAALVGGAPPIEMVGALEFQTDDDGVIVDARVGPSIPSAFGACVSAAVSGLSLPGADTGHPAVRIPLTFRPR